MASEFYEQLGIDRTASSARIRQAYGQACARLAKRRRALVEQGGATAQLDLQRARLDEAWAVLADPLRRRRYDAMLAWSEGARAKDPGVVWGEVREALVHPAAAVAAKLLRVTARLTEIGQLPLAPSGAAEDPETLIPHDDDLTTPRAARLGGRVGGRGTDAGENTSPRIAAPRAPAQRATPPSVVPATDPETDPVRAPSPRSLPPAGPALAPTPAAAPVRSAPPGSTTVPTPSAPPLVMPASSLRPPVGPAAAKPAAGAPRVSALAPEAVAALVDDHHGYSGRLLAAVRQRIGLSLQDVADHTRISVRYLEAIEAEAKAQLPSSTFVRGYVREVARLYQLDVDAVVAGYMRRFDL